MSPAGVIDPRLVKTARIVVAIWDQREDDDGNGEAAIRAGTALAIWTTVVGVDQPEHAIAIARSVAATFVLGDDEPPKRKKARPA